MERVADKKKKWSYFPVKRVRKKTKNILNVG